MKVFLIPIFCLFLLNSCKYNTEQKTLLNRIENWNNGIVEEDFKNGIFDENFKKVIIQNFTKDDLIELSSHQEAPIALYFYEILVEKYPKQAYNVFLKNINNIKRVEIWTSYDVLMETTVSDAMLYYATVKNKIFSQKKLDIISDKIILDLDNKSHLMGHLYWYFYKYKDNPNPQYYSIFKAEIQKKSPEYYLDNTEFIAYFSNYNKSEDIKLIAEYLESSIYKQQAYHNPAIEFINSSPKPEYFKVLDNFYNKKINGKKFRADDMYFELELFTKAVTKYKSEEAKNLLVKLIKETSYFSRGRFLAPNEQIYLILENEDPTKFFSDEKRILSKQINKSVLEIIRHDNKRWDKK